MGLRKERRHSRGGKVALLSALSSSFKRYAPAWFFSCAVAVINQRGLHNENETPIALWNQDSSRGEKGCNRRCRKAAAR